MNSKWVIGVIIASLALNLALVGFIVGREYKPRVEFDPTATFPRWARTLPDERKQAIRPLIREHMRTHRPHRRQMRDQSLALREAIAVEPYDRERLRAVLVQMREEYNSARIASHESFLTFVDQLTPEERQQLANDLPRRPAHRKHHRRDLKSESTQ